MSLEARLREACGAARGERAAERRRAAEALKSFLCGGGTEAAAHLLTENSARGAGLSWDDVFQDVHELVLKETEKYESNRTFSNIQATCTSLLHAVVAGANKGSTNIKCDKLLQACLCILQSPRLTKAFGHAYLILLHKHVMPCDYYLRFITPQTWEELLSACITISCRDDTNVDSLTNLRLIFQIMQNGTLYCHFAIPMRDNLPKLRQNYKQINNDNKIQEALLNIGIQLLITLSSESRLTMCEFTEAVIPVLLKFYEQNADKKKKSLLFHFLVLSVTVHHPHGRLENEKGSLARDWTVWRRHIASISDLVIVEGSFLERNLSDNKFKFHFDEGRCNLCEHYVKLSALVFYQMIETCSHSTMVSTCEGNPAKRPKIDTGVKTFNDLIMRLREHAMPWISVIAAYIKFYENTISQSDKTILLNVLENNVSSTNNKVDWNDFKTTACLILPKLATQKSDDRIAQVIQSLWNSCVRYSSVDTQAHGAIHFIIQLIVNIDFVDKKHLPPLLKLYNESAMPVTIDSVTTLTALFRKYGTKLDDQSFKLKYITWLEQYKIDSDNGNTLEELCFHLIAEEKIDLSKAQKCKNENDKLIEMIFVSHEDNILATEFEIVLWEESMATSVEKHKDISLQACDTLRDKVALYFCTKMNSEIDKYKKDRVLPVNLIHYIQVSARFCNHLLEYNICKVFQLQNDILWTTAVESIEAVFSAIKTSFNRDSEISDKIQILNSMIALFSSNHNEFIERHIRTGADEEFFRVLYEIINNKRSQSVSVDDFEVDQTELQEEDLRGIAIEFCAVYCKKKAPYREDVLELILDPNLYQFSSRNDTKVAFRCIDTLNIDTVEDKPIESLFRLIKAMCKALFRFTNASIHLVKILYRMLDDIGSHTEDTMRDNCNIMLKGYLHRCETAYYPPLMMALVFKCIVKIEKLSAINQWSSTLKESLVKGLHNSNHSLRLYTCYLLKNSFETMNENGLKRFMTGLLEIFEAEFTVEGQEMIKDEAANRTSTVLHCITSMALSRPMWMPKLIAALLEIAKTKAIDSGLICKVLELIITKITDKSTQEYLQNNIPSLLYYWFNMQVAVADISYSHFGFENIEAFIKAHMNWLIPAEVLWTKGGNIASSSLIPMLKNQLNVEENIIMNNCFCNVMMLCLPHYVHDKYNISCPRWMQVNDIAESGKQLFNSTLEWIGSDRISTLFGENFGNLILLGTRLLYDVQDLKEKFRWNGPISEPESFNYSLQSYDLVLKYFGELIDTSIMQNLCESSPLTISNIMLKLWSEIESESIFEAKLLCLYRYVILFERIPLGTPLDGYICNFVCNSLLNTLKSSLKDEKKKKSSGNICRALHIALMRILPDKLKEISKIVPQIISSLIILKNDNPSRELEELLSYLLNDMENCLKDSIDMVDGAVFLSQGRMDSYHKSSNFLVNLKNYIPKLTCYSIETLNNMKTFLTSNRTELLEHCRKLRNLKGFSEDCKDSAIHQLINSLTNIVVDSNDTKCVLAACDCLGQIGPCDLKTLVMSPPEDVTKVTCISPPQYLSLIAIQTLSANLFDEKPTVIHKTIKALKVLLSFREGKFAAEFGDVKNSNLQPFEAKRKNYPSVGHKINNEHFDSTLNIPSIWVPRDIENYDQWAIRVVTSLMKLLQSDSTYYLELLEVCQLKPSIAEKVLPPLFGLIISCASEAQTRVLSLQLKVFFQHFYENTFCSSQNSNGLFDKHNGHNLINKHKSAVETMLRVVDFVRLQRLHYRKRQTNQIETYNYLNLDYQSVAWAACMTEHSMAAVMYGELWCMSQNEGIPPVSPEVTAALPDGESVQRMFRKSYIALGDTDSIYGCGTGHLSNEAEKRNHLLRTGHFNDSLLMHDIALSRGPGNQDTQLYCLNRGVVRSFHQSGLYHMAVQYMKSLPEDNELDDIKYECYSKLGDWSLIVDKSSLDVKSDKSASKLDTVVKAYQYSCLKDCLTIASTDGYECRLQVPLENAKLAVAKLLQKANVENCQVIYNINSNLQMLQEIEDYYDLRCKKQCISELLDKWDVNYLMPFEDFKHTEPILCQRSLILEHAANLNSNLVGDVINLQLKYAELALVNGRQQMSSRLVALAKRLRPGGFVSLMDGRVFWANGHREIALHLIKSIIHDNNCTDRILRANALRQYGAWMVESKSESTRDILDKYLQQSLKALGDEGHTETKLKVYLELAKFADAEYKQVVTYMKSSIFESKVKCMKNMKGTAVSLKEQSQNTMTRDERRAINTNERLSILDEAEIRNTYTEKKRFLDLAMRYYLLTLSQGELNELSVFRVISLWLDNPTLEFDRNDDTLGQLLSAVPSRKFLPVLPQIAPRLTTETTMFASLLKKIIERCAIDHPHHTLPILFALSNSHKDQIILNVSGKNQGSSSRKCMEEPRVLAARSTINWLANADDVLAVMIKQMEQMCNAMISLANYKVLEKNRKGRQIIPRAEPLIKLKNLDSVLVPTINLPVNKDCMYTDFTSVVSFSDDFHLVGGVNAPKKMICKGSDGVGRPILLKGEDDLRQDAVMQQVFCIVNNFLEMNQETSRHKLIIRTYKVVPLSRRSGVLEWCEGTQPIGIYLVGSDEVVGAHAKYRPRDISSAAARSMLGSSSERGKSNEEKLAVFLNILSKFKPVFHHFFTENFPAPVTWYERRLAYTKSVATSSMVGYMLGIGDRHIHNILIDKKTAEVVHIDFGIAFDQGKTLPTPETVPFRLTQDIVAGFGSSGVEGVFRRSCEKTLQLLRDNQETLLTILEVLLCDPLYTWAMTPAQAKKKQNIPATPKDTSAHGAGDTAVSNSDAGGVMAERALLAVGSRLCGAEGSAGGGVAVPGLVARLLQHAMDPSNLCRLYAGWQPYV